MTTQFRMRFPAGKAKAFTMSYDDGVEQDIRLVEIMRKNGIKGTFNINSGEYSPENSKWQEGQIYRRMSLSQCLELYKHSDTEVAIHGTHHPNWDSQPASAAMWDILNDRRTLEAQYGKIIRGGAYPFGAFTDKTVEILRLAGIKYCRTVISSHSFDMPRDWLRLEPTCHHNDEKLTELIERFTDRNAVIYEPWLFYLWGHSYEFDYADNWHVIENALKKLGGCDDVWYATNMEIYDYAHAFSELIFSADAGMVYNPTATDLWGFDGKNTVKLPAGETVTL